MKYCANCGTAMPDDSAFCPECGAPQMPQQVEQPQQGEQPQQVVQPQMQQQYQSIPVPKTPEQLEADRKRLKIIAIASGVVAAILVAVVIILNFVKFPINLNKYVEVKFVGYDTIGTAEVIFDTDAFFEDYNSKFKKEGYSAYDFLDECVYGELSQTKGLKNGDVVTYKWKCNDDAAKDTFGYKIKYSDIEYTVENLSIADTFNPFQDVELIYEGISPNGYVSINRLDSDGPVGDLEYYVDKYDGLSNGDVITVSISAYGDDPATYCMENYGMIPSPMEMTFTVDGLDSFVQSVSELSEDGLAAMKAQAEDVYKAEVARNWGDGEKLESLTYIGNYLLTNKSSDSYNNNIIYMVYKVKVKNNYSNNGKKYKKTNTIYWYISYSNLLTKPNGEVTVDITNGTTPYDTVIIDSKIDSGWWSTKKWEYRGYKSLDELYSKVVAANGDEFNHEDNMDENVSESVVEDTPKDEVEGEEGIIFPDSSERRLTQDEIEALSGEDLQKAINEIYARCGYIFDSQDWTDYYNRYDWYNPSIPKNSFKDSDFNDIELANVIALRDERESRK